MTCGAFSCGPIGSSPAGSIMRPICGALAPFAIAQTTNLPRVAA